MWEAITSILVSGAGGGIVGIVSGLFKKGMDLRHEAKLEEIRLERDREDRIAREIEQGHEIEMLQLRQQGRVEQAQVETEGQAEIEALRGQMEAQRHEFGNLSTSTWMDNLRSSVRPVLAYKYSFLFTALLFWAFWRFSSMITADQGLTLLTGLMNTLEFAVMAIIGFYYVQRPGHNRPSIR